MLHLLFDSAEDKIFYKKFDSYKIICTFAVPKQNATSYEHSNR